MATATVALQLTEFASDVLAGLTQPVQKKLAPKYFYDELGSALFEAITVLPEYGLTRADERLLEAHAGEIATLAGSPRTVVELGSGSGRKTRHILLALNKPLYRPIDISAAALDGCALQLQDAANVAPIHGEWLSALSSLTASRSPDPILLLFLGSSVGNASRSDLPSFFSAIRSHLKPGDYFLLGADLVKSVPAMIEAYDDPAGVTAAFNLNVLARINRELGGNFDLRRFQHQARWNAADRAIEMHLVATVPQVVKIEALATQIRFAANESIWTESSHKFTADELAAYAVGNGFRPVAQWIDHQWPFAEVLWQAS